MRITFTMSEVAELKKYLADVVKLTDNEEVDFISLVQEMNDSKVVTCKITPKKVKIDINENYIIEFLQAYGKFANLCIPPMLQIINAVMELAETSDNIIRKYTTKEINFEKAVRASVEK